MGSPSFFAGWLDQSFWPDGIYTAPTDAALASDLEAVKTFGFNTVRLHQKINPERWYYHADRLGVIVFQDMVQKYGNADANTIPLFLNDTTAAIKGKFNHPCIVQWTVFNEGDCIGVFPNVSAVVDMVAQLDNTRLIDTNSGGPGNDLHIGDVNDIHTYPNPGDALPSVTQYGMLGEFGGIGAFVQGHMWTPDQCFAYEANPNPQAQADMYGQMADFILSVRFDLSATIYTQITDLENECDGYLNYDRTSKFTPQQTSQLVAANTLLTNCLM